MSEGAKLAIEIVVAIIIVGGVVSSLFLHKNWKLDSILLSRVFFWFALVCGLFGVFTQYGANNQLGDTNLFGDASFYFLLGSLSMLGAIYWNTDKTNHLL